MGGKSEIGGDGTVETGMTQWKLALAAEVTCQRLAEMGLELVPVAVAEQWVTCQSLA